MLFFAEKFLHGKQAKVFEVSGAIYFVWGYVQWFRCLFYRCGKANMESMCVRTEG